MKEVSYEHIDLVLRTWDEARFECKNFEKEFGMVALEKLFELQPRAKKVFGYDKGEEEGAAHAAVHANAFAGVFDSVFQMLGPDIEFLEEILAGVGRRHKVMGVNPSFFPFMGIAVKHAMEHFLKRELKPECHEAWDDVYDAISNEIIKNILA